MTLRLWRIVTGPHPIWSGEGARLFGQRWNVAGQAAIYTGTSFALCLVEVLVHANRRVPPRSARYVEAHVPEGVSRETFDAARWPGWDDVHDLRVPQAFGRDWLAERRSALLFIPSVVTAGRDMNVLVNPDHLECAQIVVSDEKAVVLDPRLFGP